MSNFPEPSVGSTNKGKTVASAPPTDEPSAIQVILDAAQSGTGKANILAGTNSAAVVGALVIVTGSATVLGVQAAAILTAVPIAALTFESTWGDAFTAIDALP